MYNPYLNQYYNQQPIPKPQPIDYGTQIMARNNMLYGKQVESIDVVKAMDITLDGNINYFPLLDKSAIITKQLQPDGTSKMIVYKPVNSVEKPEFATTQDLERLEQEIKELKTKLEPTKED